MIELNKFYIGESVNFMKENIPDNFVDLTVTSPPYDDLRKYNSFIFDYKSMANELYRVTKNGGIVVWIVGDRVKNGSESGNSFKQALYFMNCGFNIHDTMIYAKNNPVPQADKTRYTQAFEYIFVFSKGKPKTVNRLMIECQHKGKVHYGKNKINDQNCDRYIDRAVKDFKPNTNIWFYNVGINQSSKDKIASKHHAIFPEQLAEDNILSWSNEGDIVFDPMCGSGTTCKMAYLNKRNFIGVDMSEEYINEICIPRLTEYGWKETLEFQQQVFRNR